MAEDDIIELTDIIKAGHAPAQLAAAGRPAAAAETVEPQLPADFMAESVADEVSAPVATQVPDFGADLDALLQNYDKPSAVAPVPVVPAPAAPAAKAAPTPEAVAAQPGEAVAAPIANQDNSGRAVDPNEELDLPPLSDLDALLEELGVQDNGPAASLGSTGFSIVDDLDAMPAPGMGLAAKSTPAPAADSQPDVNLAAVAAGVAAAKSTPATQADELFEVSAAPELAAPAAEASADVDDGIDLNELDALLDSVLSVAPRPAAEIPAAEPDVPPVSAPGNSSGDVSVEFLQNEIAVLKAEMADLKNNIDKYAAAAAAKVIREEIAAIAAHLE